MFFYDQTGYREGRHHHQQRRRGQHHRQCRHQLIVEHGVNITAACRSIMSEVRYKVNKYTGAEVKSVDVCVDSIVL